MDSVRPGDGAEPAPSEWDERYASAERVWSGEPNATLVEVASALNPGRALDVGCGEGADAVWLAAHGWEVTAIDVSPVALQRAAAHARAAGVTVSWRRAGLLDAALAPAAFDLVSAQYPALRRAGPGDNANELALLAAVAPGGTLLVVHHAQFDTEHARAAGFDPDDYVSPADVAGLLDDEWQFEIEENRPRHVTSGAGAHRTADYILRAAFTPRSGGAP
jgi:SAM-dependent methyltransferase